MSNNSSPPGPQSADFARLVRAIDDLCEYVRPLAGKTLTVDELEELGKLEQEFWDAQGASKLCPPQIPDPNPEDLPPEQHWHPRGLADLYTGPNREEAKPDDVEWLFHDRLQVPPGWWESMERLRRTAQRRGAVPDKADGANAQKSSLHPPRELEEEQAALTSPLGIAATFPRPRPDAVRAAQGAIPSLLVGMRNGAFANRPAEPPNKVVQAISLRRELVSAGHNVAAAHWAILQSVDDGLLRAEIIIDLASTGNPDPPRYLQYFERAGNGPRFEPTPAVPETPRHIGPGPIPFDAVLIYSTDRLWTAWSAEPPTHEPAVVVAATDGTVAVGTTSRPEIAAMSSTSEPPAPIESLNDLHSKAQELLTFVDVNQPRADQRKLTPEQWAHLHRLEAEVIAGCLVLNVPVPAFPEPADSGPFWEDCARLGALKIPYVKLGWHHPKPMLLPTPAWFQAMRTFVLSLEMRARAAPNSPDRQAGHPTPHAPPIPQQPFVGRPAGTHPFFEFRDIAQRIIQTAPAAYRFATINRSYWDEYGRTTTDRLNTVNSRLRGLASEGIARISVEDQWGRLGTTNTELNRMLTMVAWNLGQAASVPFPDDEDGRYPNADVRPAQSVEKLVSDAWGYLESMRPILTALAALLVNPASETTGAGAPAEGPRPVACDLELSERQDSILSTMLEMGATSERLRRTRQAIASKVQRGLSASSIGVDFAVLKDSGFIRSKEGNKGGCWLTQKGIDRAKMNLLPPTGKNP